MTKAEALRKQANAIMMDFGDGISQGDAFCLAEMIIKYLDGALETTCRCVELLRPDYPDAVRALQRRNRPITHFWIPGTDLPLCNQAGGDITCTLSVNCPKCRELMKTQLNMEL